MERIIQFLWVLVHLVSHVNLTCIVIVDIITIFPCLLRAIHSHSSTHTSLSVPPLAGLQLISLCSLIALWRRINVRPLEIKTFQKMLKLLLSRYERGGWYGWLELRILSTYEYQHSFYPSSIELGLVWKNQVLFVHIKLYNHNWIRCDWLANLYGTFPPCCVEHWWDLLVQHGCWACQAQDDCCKGHAGGVSDNNAILLASQTQQPCLKKSF